MHRKSSVKNKERKVVVLIQLFSFYEMERERGKIFENKKKWEEFLSYTQRESKAGLMEGGPMAPRIWEVESGSGTLHPLAPFVSLPPTAMADPIFI
jgi:hypothetical protein